MIYHSGCIPDQFRFISEFSITYETRALGWCKLARNSTINQQPFGRFHAPNIILGGKI
jgi:hypothetical protein